MLNALFILLMILSGTGAKDTDPEPLHASRHDFHITTGRMAIEGNKAILQIRMFVDDLEKGLQTYHNDESIRMNVDPLTDSLFTVYLNDKLILKNGDEVLQGVVATSGEDVLYGFPVWWYTLNYKSSAPINSLDIDHQVLMEIFRDQQNILRITHYPSEEEKMYYMVNGDSDISLTF